MNFNERSKVKKANHRPNLKLRKAQMKQSQAKKKRIMLMRPERKVFCDIYHNRHS